MTIRQSRESDTHRPSTDTWPHDLHSVEMQPSPMSRLPVSAWRTSTDNDAIRTSFPASNPFQPPLRNPFLDPLVTHDEAPIQHLSAAHTHPSHAGTHQSPFHGDIEAPSPPSVVPKAPGTPSITALPLHLPYDPPRSAHSQTIHRTFLFIRLGIQILLFVLSLIGFLLKYPTRITYVGMLTGNSLAFVLIWGGLLVIVYLVDGVMRMSRYSNEKEQWRKCGRMVVFDLMIVGVWLLVCWGNTGMFAFSSLPFGSD